MAVADNPSKSTVADYPHLVAEWAWDYNGQLRPDHISYGSAQKVWWRCPEGPDHRWYQAIRARTVFGRGCPFCIHFRLSITNSLQALAPALAAEWHPDRNGDLRPERVKAHSSIRVWWRCPKGPDHEWQELVDVRYLHGNRCPMCIGSKPSVTHALAVNYPGVSSQWHPTKNGDLKPSEVSMTSEAPVWWKCAEGPDHEWQASPFRRTSKGQGCPFCANVRVSVTNSVEALAPEMALLWHATKNGTLTPSSVILGSEKPVWWKCPNGPDHEWQAPPYHRRLRKSCPFCLGRRASVTNSFAARAPHLAAEWHPTKNGDLTPHDVPAGSTRLIWWQCLNVADHVWQMNPWTRLRGGGCRDCRRSRPSKRSAPTPGRSAFTPGRSAPTPGHFASTAGATRADRPDHSLRALSPALAAHWHPEKNGDLRPEHIGARSSRKVWWRCPKGPDHEWQSRVGYRYSSGNECPMCTGVKPSVTHALLVNYPGLSSQWHPTRNGDLKPSDVSIRSKVPVWWKCAEGPDHEWQGSPAHRTAYGRGCPYCAKRLLSVNNSLEVRAPDVARQWHPTKNGTLKPSDVSYGSITPVWWKCPKGPDHEWQSAPSFRGGSRGCPFCSGKRVSTTNSVAARAPHLVAEWHPTKNGDLTPHDLTTGSTRKVWWQCLKVAEHVWPAPPSSRTQGRGCRYCAGFKLPRPPKPSIKATGPSQSPGLPVRLRRNATRPAGLRRRGRGGKAPDGERSVGPPRTTLADYPHLMAEWAFDLNGDLSPPPLRRCSGRAVWWRCPKGPDHVWKATVSNRVRGSGCPFCVNRAVSATTSLEHISPRLAAEWHPTKNGTLRPGQVVPGSGKDVWWKCPKGPDHEWQAAVGERYGGHGCPMCSRRRISVTNSLLWNHPAIASEWHPTKNGELDPSRVSDRSAAMAWWKCAGGPDHEWKTSPVRRILKGAGCPYCLNRRVSVTNSLQARAPEIALEWHPVKNHGRTPADMTFCNPAPVWWKCPNGPDHEWMMSPESRVVDGNGCLLCRDHLPSDRLAPRAPQARSGAGSASTSESSRHT